VSAGTPAESPVLAIGRAPSVATPRSSSLLTSSARVFLGDRQAVTGGAIILLVSGAALAAPLISPHDPLLAVEATRLTPPGVSAFLLGTDEQGRDILSRLIWGGRISLLVGIVPTAVAGAWALILGMLAGYYEGALDHVIMRALDVFFAFPLVLLAIAIVGVIGPGVGNQMFALTVVLIPYSTRVVRTATLTVKKLEYVEASRGLGSPNLRILGRHILPNVLPPLLVYTSTLVGMMIVASAGLSFLGLGIQPPTPDWGVMVGSGRLVLYRAAHVATVPGIVIVIVALAFNFVGEGLREALNPRARQ
jgi:peptide/nickel transport system permease protein